MHRVADTIATMVNRRRIHKAADVIRGPPPAPPLIAPFSDGPEGRARNAN